MKPVKLILISLLMISVNHAFPQVIIGGEPQTPPTQETDHTLKYFNKTEAGVSFGLGYFKTDIYEGIQRKLKNDELVVTLQTVNGFKFMDRLGIGASVGMEKWRNGLFWPVYGYLGYDFSRTENRIYASVYLGYTFGTRDSTTYVNKGKGAFALSIAIGYRMKLSKSVYLVYEAFYKYQSLESSYQVWTKANDSTLVKTTVDYKVPLHFAGFKIGVSFP